MNPGHFFPFLPVVFYLIGAFYPGLFYIGFALQSAYILQRGISLGRLPLVGVHDTLAFLSASLILFSIPFYSLLKNKKEFRWMLSGLALVFSLAPALSPAFMRPLPPVLKTYWFELHVALSFLSYALFGIGAMLGISYLKDPASALEKSQYRTVLTGYLLFSLSMIFGGIWAYLAWGTYWLWTPKELWTSILWLYFTFYLHVRFFSSWRGKRAAIAGSAGFLVVLFTYLGVSLLMKSSHAF
jgi:ABC-type transport system involved in cytochrome c biogenesis permease subunit